jgi:cyclic beta-1,2-glucan synthetase
MESTTQVSKHEESAWSFIGVEFNRDYAVSQLAHMPAQKTSRIRPINSIQKDIDQFESIIKAGYKQYQETSELLVNLSPAAEWMLDNFVIIEQSIRLIRESLPFAYEKQLPRYTEQPYQGDIRILYLSFAILRTGDFLIDNEQTKEIINYFQQIQPLSTGELWALPSFLRYALLAILAYAISNSIEMTIEDKMPAHLTRLVEDINLTADELAARIIPGLRQLSATDWQLFFEETSPIERILYTDPAKIYPTMDFASRNRYRQSLEYFSMHSHWNEIEIANIILHRCQQHMDKIKNLHQSAETEFQILQRKTHVGYYLSAEGRNEIANEIKFRPGMAESYRQWAYQNAGWAYFLPLSLLTSGMLFGIYSLFPSGTALFTIILFLLLAFIPALSIGIGIVNFFISKFFPPFQLPKLDFSDSIPDEFRSAVVMPILLDSKNEISAIICQLEKHYLSNPDKNLRFILLTDFMDADQETLPEDTELLKEVSYQIQELNNKYQRVFFLLHRKRLWNVSENCWMGWERKRGKLSQFNQFLLNPEENPYETIIGDTQELRSIRYVITLDSDTDLPYHTANKLIGTLAHPLNQAVFDTKNGKVIFGYAILQPRVQINPSYANNTWFSRIFADDTYFDLYSRAISDVYMDLFHEGIFIGKGIYDVKAFSRSMHGRVLENTLLSHDLFEGIFSRVALASDITVYEDFPGNIFSYFTRQHRWIRGDWQLTPWLLPKIPNRYTGQVVNGLSGIGRWKIWDNLRRSLLSSSLLLMLIFTWFFYPELNVFSFFFVCIAAFFPVILHFIDNGFFGLFKQIPNYPFSRSLLALVLLVGESAVNMDAIVSVLYRIYVSRKRLLQWVTSAHTIHLSKNNPKHSLVWRRMAKANIILILIFVLLFFFQFKSVLLAIPWIILWLSAPQVSILLSKPIQSKEEVLSPRAEQTFRNIALRTWMFFETYVGPEDSWLPPDHYQESPRGVIAHRTSPTNIGLYLLSTISGYELGYVTSIDLIYRVQQTLETIGKMEHYRGHLYNWYDTQSLIPLPPRYISTVDSGNLVACYIALNTRLQNIGRDPIIKWQQFEGLLDCFSVIQEIIEEIPLPEERQAALFQISKISMEISGWESHPANWVQNLRDFIENRWENLEEIIITLIEENSESIESETINAIRVWMGRTHYQADNMLSNFQYQAPWVVDSKKMIKQIQELNSQEPGITGFVRLINETIEITVTQPFLEISSFLRQKQAEVMETIFSSASGQLRMLIIDWIEMFEKNLETYQRIANMQLQTLQMLKLILDQYIQDMKFNFLFHPERQVFHIGYNLETGQLDANYYDLLASESRIASYIAIAKGDVPQSHWKHLARPVTRIENHSALLSWSATMFEYLMPGALMKTPRQSLLGETIHNVIELQISYAKRHHVPWGISESGYYHFDAQKNYQYRAFGTPGLGLKRGLADDLVIAPYASLMCIAQAPSKVFENIISLNQFNSRGTFGYYEALDFTPERSPDQKGEIVKSYMAHHQGMILAAICNHLKDNVLVGAFHADPEISSSEILLYETIGRDMPLDYPHTMEIENQIPQRTRIVFDPWSPSPYSAPPILHLLSNGKYHTAVSSDGAGFSRYGERDITRWRHDSSLNQYGSWCYLFDHTLLKLWSIAENPVPVSADFQEVTFHTYKVEFTKRAFDIAARMDIIVAADDDIEIRRIQLTNQSEKNRIITISSYAEIILSDQSDDLRHQAFNKLFIDNHVNTENHCILFSRRQHSTDEVPLFFAHAWFCDSDAIRDVEYITDRKNFIGHTRDIHTPAVFSSERQSQTGRQTEGDSLDPIASINVTFHIPAHQNITLYFLSTATIHRPSIELTIKKYSSQSFLQRCFDTEKIKAERNLQKLNIEPHDIEFFDKFYSLILYPNHKLRTNETILQRNIQGQSGLWPFGISGDLPICLLKISKLEQLNNLSKIIKGYIYWRSRSIKLDLVILNERDTSYDQELNTLLQRLFSKLGANPWMNIKGGIFILRSDQITIESRNLLETSANIILTPNDEAMHDLLYNLFKPSDYLPDFHASLPPIPEKLGAMQLSDPEIFQFNNGYGGFSTDGREYHIHMDQGHIPPTPWINVIANANFGFVISESGISWTWAGNSGENRLTSWSNDPILDQPGEALYLRDEETGQFWSPSFLPVSSSTPYEVIHGLGYSKFLNCSYGIQTELTYLIDRDDPIKIIRLRMRNTRDMISRISSMYYADWVLGSIKNQGQLFIQQHFDTYLYAILASNNFQPDFAKRVAFLASTRIPQAITSNRAEFLGRNGSFSSPAALHRVSLSGQISSSYDPCAAMSHIIWLSPGEEKEITYLLGQGNDEEEAKRLINKYQHIEQVESSETLNKRFWTGLTESVQVKTPHPSFDIMLNQWLLYQSVSCRFFGRSAFYQSSGAYGFRDQLQDSLAYLSVHPEWTREFIIEAASMQFKEGDVLHWWHPPARRGVRTRCSDDMLWLPYCVSEYLLRTGDDTILEERIPFLDANELQENEHDRYDQFPQNSEQYSLLDHCLRAIQRGSTTGPHGLPLIGSHDWNDGFSRVGLLGKGESVWLGWFLAVGLERFADLCKKHNRTMLADQFLQTRGTLIQNLLQHAWDGRWFLRAFFDNGTPLGSQSNSECKIDAIAQSWAVFAGLQNHPYVQTALQSVQEYLINEKEQLVLLFTPPLDSFSINPGYIKGYQPGIRENGGQYTHAAAWTIWAYADAGQADLAFKLYQMINPIHHSDSLEKADIYGVEPYVIAADVYSAPQHLGRGGWTWYTGSASWMYRLGIERILGLQLQKEGFTLNPAIPKEWEEYQLTLRLPKGSYNVTVKNPMRVHGGIAAVIMDGQPLRSKIVPWVEDHDIHTVVFRLGQENG